MKDVDLKTALRFSVKSVAATNLILKGKNQEENCFLCSRYKWQNSIDGSCNVRN
jgi:hypothetical protein